MVTPLGQRMVFQTSFTEAARVAHDIASQLQREDTFRQVLAERMARETDNIRVIQKSEAMKAEERKERQRRSRGQPGNEDGDGDMEDTEEQRAVSADGTLDFLA